MLRSVAFTSAVAIKSARFRPIGSRLAIQVNASNKRKSERKEMKVGKLSAFIVGALLWASMPDAASAADTLKRAIGQRGNWATPLTAAQLDQLIQIPKPKK
jgi:hypothetical protein